MRFTLKKRVNHSHHSLFKCDLLLSLVFKERQERFTHIVSRANRSRSRSLFKESNFEQKSGERKSKFPTLPWIFVYFYLSTDLVQLILKISIFHAVLTVLNSYVTMHVSITNVSIFRLYSIYIMHQYYTKYCIVLTGCIYFCISIN